MPEGPFEKTRRLVYAADAYTKSIQYRIKQLETGAEDHLGTPKDPWQLKDQLKWFARFAAKARRAYNRELRAFLRAQR